MYNALAGMILSLSVLTQPEEDIRASLGYKPGSEDDMDDVLEFKKPRDGWLGQVIDDAERQLSIKLEDRFGPRAYISTWFDAKFDRWEYETKMRKRGVDTIKRSFREAGIDFARALPVADSLMDYGLGLFERVYGRTDEVDLEPEDNTERIVHRSWWKRIRARGFDWGARPFRQSPYAFMSFTLGQSDGEPILFSHVRYHYEKLQRHRAEALFIVPLPDKWGFAAGYTLSHDPSVGDGDAYVTLRLERVIASHSEIYAGANVGGGRDAVIVGFSGRF